ncbi:MAG: phosphoribosylamine--glycine ligase [Vampirovibrio sp.]|nr:phosphoribosylamine--glycine ligase [Vampirovibrio sp.]
MKVLIIGSGGREHAIGWKLAQSPLTPDLYFAPGNPGVENIPNSQRLEIDPLDLDGLALFATREGIDLTVVGPEAPLANGITDRFQQDGLLVFGPNKAGAELEASKVFAKEVMTDANVPTAGYAYCETKAEADKALKEFKPPFVIKEDGLAAGKGVTIAPDEVTAIAALEAAFAKDQPVIIEEFLVGEELSVLAICDGQKAVPMIGSQDFKKRFENNEGPNTGGMGAYAPVPFVTPPLMAQIQDKVLAPTLNTLKARGIDFRGVMYAGLMIAPDGTLNVLEYNCRFGDPETQVVLPLLADDLLEVLLAAAKGDLSKYPSFQFKNQAAMTVVLASKGYPGDYPKGIPITLPQNTPEDVTIFHAGTKKQPDQQIVTHGGRVMNVTALGNTLEEARQKTYTAIESIQFETKVFRTDIAEVAAKAPATVG